MADFFNSCEEKVALKQKIRPGINNCYCFILRLWPGYKMCPLSETLLKARHVTA